MLSVKQGSIKYHFLSLWYDSTGIEPRSPGPLANTLTIMLMSGICSSSSRSSKNRGSCSCRLVGWLIVVFYGVSTLFGPFYAQ